MEDLYKDVDLGRVLRHFHRASKTTALICHGPVALLSAAVTGKPWAYKGYKMTAFSNAEERQVEDQGGLSGGKAPFYIADALTSLGGIVQEAKPWKSFAIRDRELITGQNPMSDGRFTQLFLESLIEQKLKNKERVNANEINPNAVNVILGGGIDWGQGHTTLYIGKNKVAGKFISQLSDHVLLVEKNFSSAGLQGYLVVIHNGLEIALQNWSSKEAMENVLQTALGQEVVNDANKFLQFVDFFKVSKEHTEFLNNIELSIIP